MRMPSAPGHCGVCPGLPGGASAQGWVPGEEQSPPLLPSCPRAGGGQLTIVNPLLSKTRKSLWGLKNPLKKSRHLPSKGVGDNKMGSAEDPHERKQTSTGSQHLSPQRAPQGVESTQHAQGPDSKSGSVSEGTRIEGPCQSWGGGSLGPA